MTKRIAYIVIFFLFPAVMFAQQKLKIDLNPQKQISTRSEQLKNRSHGFVLSEKIAAVEFMKVETKEGLYHQLLSEGMSKTFDPGKPDLPVINRLIEIPFDAEASVKILSYDEQIIELKEYNLSELIIPAQASVEKSKAIKDAPFVRDDQVYTKNDFFKNELVKLEDKGYLRDKHLGYIEIAPFAYNPVSNSLKVFNNIEIEVIFTPKSDVQSSHPDRLKSPYFQSLALNTINASADSKALISGPIKYVIVSHPMFKESLKPFVEWKTMKGFKVIEAYTDVIGGTTTEIRSYLKNLYDNPADGVSPSFLLIVGDVAQVPSFSGSTGGHKTDLYYAEYTGDKLPELFYGRFSAENHEELQAQIDKTLEIEKYEMPDPSYLKNVILIAGVDGSYASKWGNGVINYANDYYTNLENDITSYYYLYNDNSGVMASNSAGASTSIRNYISSGVSFVNYSAHCGVSGWSDPSFNTSHVDGLTNAHMYPLIIGNCCESNTFASNDCFGEKLLIAPNKGAVGYIGGSNLTYWDEDYWWGIGLTSSITAYPSYENSGLGAYDRYFHSNGEAKSDWYITQGQINVAGNLAVEASTSSRKGYYWEVYHLMGDPSLTPYVSVPELLLASYNSEIITGSVILQVVSEKDSYVAVSRDGVLLDAKMVDASGVVELSFSPLAETGILDIVITKQNRQAIIDKIDILPATTPYVILDYYTLDDLSGNNNGEVDYGETIKLDVQLKNLSDTYDAYNVSANLSSADTNVIISDYNQVFGPVLALDSTFMKSSFTIDFKNKFNNQHKLSFNLDVNGEDLGKEVYSWNSKINLNVNAPEIKAGDLLLDDQMGNADGILSPGETADLLLVITNNGNAAIEELAVSIAPLGDGVSNLVLNSTLKNVSLNALQSDTVRFSVTANADAPEGTFVYLYFDIHDVAFNYYSSSINKELIIGEIPEILISQQDTVVINNARFYDSGGETNSYKENEEYTISFKPEETKKFISANFLAFNVESHSSCNYDKLKIYNGLSTNDELIGEYCGSDSPGYIMANNADGALTFAFTSDYDVEASGWEADLRSYSGCDLQLTVNGPNGPIDNAIVEFVGRTDSSDVNGMVLFGNIPEGIDYPLRITAPGYELLDTMINMFENTFLAYTLEFSKFDVSFSLSDKEGAIDGAISFDERTLSTVDGNVTFTDVKYSDQKEFVIQSYGHIDTSAFIEVKKDLEKSIEMKALRYNIEFVLSDGADPVAGAVVDFGTKTILSNIDGVALFEQVKMDSLLKYVVRKTDYNNIEGTMDVKRDSIVRLTMGTGTAYFKVAFLVSGNTNPIYNAQVILNVDTAYTNPEGIAIFENIPEQNDVPYKISKTHFNDIMGTIDIAGSNVTLDTSLSYKTYEIIFSIDDGIDPLEGVVISFDGKSGTSDINGDYLFEVLYSLNKTYEITKEAYKSLGGMINVNENKRIELSMSLQTYDVTFVVVDPESLAVEGVKIEFNEENKYTDIDGEVVFPEVLPGESLAFTLMKDGFWNYDSTLNVVGADVVFNARLSSTTGIIPIAGNEIKIYPNPSSGLFSVEIQESQNTSYRLKIFNVIGENIFTKEIPGTSYIKEQVDISHSPNGMYFLSIELENGVLMSRKIIIK